MKYRVVLKIDKKEDLSKFINYHMNFNVNQIVNGWGKRSLHEFLRQLRDYGSWGLKHEDREAIDQILGLLPKKIASIELDFPNIQNYSFEIEKVEENKEAKRISRTREYEYEE